MVDKNESYQKLEFDSLEIEENIVVSKESNFSGKSLIANTNLSI